MLSIKHHGDARAVRPFPELDKTSPAGLTLIERKERNLARSESLQLALKGALMRLCIVAGWVDGFICADGRNQRMGR